MNKLFIALLGAIVIVAVTADDSCTTHVENCYTCETGGTVCSACVPGYSLGTDKACVKCTDSNALTCNPTTPATALTCKPGYTINSGTTCVACDLSQCGVCAAKATCDSCKAGYSLNSAGDACVDCTDAQAVTCNPTTPATALTCNSGWTTNSGTTCVACETAGCGACAAKATCDSCASGYYVSGATCVKCADDCDECASTSTCSVCSADNNLLSSDKKSCSSFGFKATASFALVAAALLSFVF